MYSSKNIFKMIKTLKYFLPIVFVCFFTSNLFAQKAENPWAVSVGADLIYFNSNENIEDVFSFGAPVLSLSYYLGAGFSLSTQYVSNEIGKTNSDVAVTSFDNYIKYNLSEKDLMPYLFAGYGFTKFSEGRQNSLITEKGTTNSPLVGVGLNYFLNDNLALNLSVSYRNSNDEKSYNHLQHIIGLSSYNFGIEDSDKDDVPDKRDACPNVPGLKEFAGCPDTDGDGIPDHQDACPEAAGTKINLGCPDTDGDGITDNKDACPKRAGTFEVQGCPDRDGDGITDDEDKCLEISGKPNNRGCPVAERDSKSIINKEDSYSDVAGQETITESHESAAELVQFLISDQSKIVFVVNSYQLDQKAETALLHLTRLMVKFPKTNIYIEGHTSNDGTWIYNMKLSEKRAKEVKKYLIGKGINGSRIRTLWFGEDRPIGNNSTQKGKEKNRRVKIN